MVRLEKMGQLAGYYSLGRVDSLVDSSLQGCSLFLKDLHGVDRELFLNREHATELCRWFEAHLRNECGLLGYIILESMMRNEESVVMCFRIDGESWQESGWLLLYDDYLVQRAAQFAKIELDTESMQRFVFEIASQFKISMTMNMQLSSAEHERDDLSQ